LKLITSERAHKPTAEYQERLCKHYGFPWKDVEYKKKKGNRERNEILNQVLSADIVFIIQRDPCKITFYRMADKTTVDIQHPSMLLTQMDNQPKFGNAVRSKNPYLVVAKFLNSPSESCLRHTLQKKMTAIENLEHRFLSSTGFINNNFKQCRSLEQLKRKHQLSLLHDTDDGGLNSIPEIILAIVSLVYECNITLYNIVKKRTYHYSIVDTRSIEYILKGCNFIPRTESCILLLDENSNYILKNSSSKQRLRLVQPENLFSVTPFGGRSQIVRKIGALPNLRQAGIRGRQNFHKAISNLLKEVRVRRILPHFLLDQKSGTNSTYSP
jgi:hypothetical protein